MIWLPMRTVTTAPAADVTKPLPSPSPSVIPVRVTGATGPICILPTGRPKVPVELVKVP